MKTRSTPESGSPRELVRLRAWRLDVLSEAPKLPPTDVETRLNMGQFSGLFQDQTSPDRLTNGISSRTPSSGAIPPGLLQTAAASPSPEPAAWSSAVGHASTGKSGRVIERLQGEIDRLNRDLHLLKARMDDSERAREALAIRNSTLEDHNSVYEQSQANHARELQRKERQVNELREDFQSERRKATTAEKNSKDATAQEAEWRDVASQARALASQKEMEYNTLANCRNLEKESYQNSVKGVQSSFQSLLADRTKDQSRFERLGQIAEQQKRAIVRLEELNRKTSLSFEAYRHEVDAAIADLKANATSHDANVISKLEEMTRVTGQMKWVMAVDRNSNSNSSHSGSSEPGQEPDQKK